MAAIALAESSGRMDAQDDDSNGTVDLGLWQINSIHGYDPNQLVNNANYNTKAAIAVLNSQGLGAWSTYNSGAYKKYLPGGGGVATTSTTGKGSSMFTRPGGTSPGSSSSLDDWLTSYTSGDDSQAETDPNTGQVETVGFFSSIWNYVNSGLNYASLGIFGDPNDPSLGIHNGPGLGAAFADVNDMLDAVRRILWILNPFHILQMVEFLTGMALMAFGIQAAVQGRSESNEGFQTGEAAISRSGLGRVSRELAAGVTRGKSGSSGGQRRLRPAPAPHKVRRTALQVRYAREQKVADRNTEKRRSGT